MNDFEKHIKSLLNQQIDAELGGNRTAPPFDRNAAPLAAGKSRHSRGGPWVIPLLAAACVAIVVGGTAGATALLADHRHHAPATQEPTPTRLPTESPAEPTATPSGSAGVPTRVTSSTHASSTAPSSSTPATSPSVSATQTKSSSVTPLPPVIVTLAGATLTLPAGYEAHSAAGSEIFSGSGPKLAGAWCLTPSSGWHEDCRVAFIAFDAPGSGETLDVDAVGAGMTMWGERCVDIAGASDQSATRTFGGRMAEWRTGELPCVDGGYQLAEQYVIPTAPGYLLYSDYGRHDLSVVMSQIARTAKLPAQDRSLRLTDRGAVTAVQTAADGVRVTIERYVDHSGEHWVDEHATATYLVPQALFDAAAAKEVGGRAVRVGDRVYLQTDGSAVTVFRPDGP